MVSSTQITPVRPEKMADYDGALTGTVVTVLANNAAFGTVLRTLESAGRPDRKKFTPDSSRNDLQRGMKDYHGHTVRWAI